MCNIASEKIAFSLDVVNRVAYYTCKKARLLVSEYNFIFVGK